MSSTPQRIECSSQAEFDACVAAGNVAVVRAGFFVARGSSRVEAWGSSRVEAWGSSRVVAWDSSSVVAWDSSSVVAWDSSSVEARGSVIVRLWRALSIKAGLQVTIVKHGPAQALEGGRVVEIAAPTTAAEWCDYHGIEVKGGVAILYKAVRSDYRSARGGDYTPGTVPVAPDWDGGERECGGGLHFSPTVRHTRQFEGEAVHYLACPVTLTDMRAPQAGDTYPNKIKARGCCAPVWEVDIDGKPIKQEAA